MRIQVWVGGCNRDDLESLSPTGRVTRRRKKEAKEEEEDKEEEKEKDYRSKLARRWSERVIIGCGDDDSAGEGASWLSSAVIYRCLARAYAGFMISRCSRSLWFLEVILKVS